MLKHLQSSEDWNEKSLGAKGFTLIELLVVVIILGILAAVAVFAVGSLTKNAKQNACKTEQSTLKTAVQAYKAQNDNVSTGITVAKMLESAGGNLNDTPKYFDVDTSGVVIKLGGGAAAGVCDALS